MGRKPWPGPVVDRYGLDPIIAAARAWTVAGSSVTIRVHETDRHTTGEPTHRHRTRT